MHEGMKTNTISCLIRILAPFGMALMFLAGCEKQPAAEPPTLSTFTVSDITGESAKSGGYITDDGGSSIISRGVVWSTYPNPTLDTNEGMTTDGAGEGIFHSYLTGLLPETTYYLRAYAINSLGESYGNEISFTTLSPSAIGMAVTDIEGNQYSTIIINGKEWMRENLRTRSYSNGTSIPTGLGTIQWQEATSGAYAIYPYDHVDGINSYDGMLNAYGILYNWYTVERGNLCPVGWRVPDVSEWEELAGYIIENHQDVNQGNVGNSLKSCRQEDSPLGGDCDVTGHPRWNPDNTHYGTDDFGFAALPGGYRNFGGYYDYIGSNGFWWTSSEGGMFFAWVMTIASNSGNLTRSSYRKQLGFSIRCIRDAD